MLGRDACRNNSTSLWLSGLEYYTFSILTEGFTPPFIPPHGPNMRGQTRVTLSCFHFLAIFVAIHLLTHFWYPRFSDILPSWSQHVRFLCPTWLPKRGQNRLFLEFKTQLMLQEAKMLKFVQLSSENPVFTSSGHPKNIQQSIKNRS